MDLKMWKKKINFTRRANHKLYLENVFTNKPEYEYQHYAQILREQLKTHRRFVKDGGCEGRDSVTKENESA